LLLELKAIAEQRLLEGEGCSGCDGYSKEARVTVDTGLVSNAQWKLLIIVSKDVTSVRAVSMNATVVVTGWLESWMQSRVWCRWSGSTSNGKGVV
jgi:hypothetical protein